MKTVGIVGRSNVGKSTLFNRIIKEKRSIVLDTYELTRDRIYETVTYNDKKFNLIDTGGIETSKENFQEHIKIQSELAILESDIILFVIDGRSELTESDYLIRDLLKRSNKEIIVLLNKIDDPKHKENIYNYYSLGFNKYIPISAEHNLGISEVLDEVTKDMKVYKKEERDLITFSIIGRENVGKSSLINAILNENRAIVSDVPGTTRDSIDADFNYHNMKFTCIDTAGIKRKGKMSEEILKYSYFRSLKAIERSDVSVLVLDATEGITNLDTRIASHSLDNGNAIVIAFNKWDLIKDKGPKRKELLSKVEESFKFMPYVNVVFLSALNKSKIHVLMDEIITGYNNHSKKVQTSVLNNIIRDAAFIHAPPSKKGRKGKIYYSHQYYTNPPKFNIIVNDPELFHFSYKRFIENKIRESVDFTNTPIFIKFTKKNDRN